MSTITAILDPDTDGSIHVPLPPELRGGKVRITATMEAVEARPRRTLPSATPEAIERREKAFEALRKVNPYRDVEDPVAWQREIRKDRPLPDRV